MDVHIIGEIKGTSGITLPNLSCHFKVLVDTTNDGWIRKEGEDDNYTQICAEELITWSHPLDLSFSTTSVEAWPLVYLEVWTQNELKRNDIVGYGICPVPSVPGEYEDLDAVIWRPYGSPCERLRATFLGGWPQLLDPEAVLLGATAAGSVDFKTETMGRVHLSLHVMVHGDIGNQGIILARE